MHLLFVCLFVKDAQCTVIVDMAYAQDLHLQRAEADQE